jgi:signal transduction histidine kinase
VIVRKGVRTIFIAITLALLLGFIDLLSVQLGFPLGGGHIRPLLLVGLFVLMVYLVVVIRSFARARTELELRDRELMALHTAAVDMMGNLSLDAVLQRVVDYARQLVKARYGALSVIAEDNRIRSFITAGVNPEERRAIGDPPSGRGLLGVVLHEGRHLRLADISRDPRSVGFPAGHPPMKSLLAVPIPSRGGFRGNFYMSDKEDAAEFSPRDEETLMRFAVAAANAIDSAALHEKLSSLAIAEERVRIAHELHDGMAQVLAYVNTKAQAVQELLARGRGAEAEAQLEQLASAAREVYADAREGILGLRSGGPDVPLGKALAEYLERWRHQSGVEVEAQGLEDEGLVLGAMAELQVMRIVQEALANVRKHAHASRVRVVFERDRQRVVATVTDDGRGFEPENISRRGFPRFGLATMRERAESVGALLRVDSGPSGGTRVRVELPVDNSTPR